MKCEICNENEATVHIKQVYNGVVKEMFICEECAAQYGLDQELSNSLTDFLFEIGVETTEEDSNKSCPVCHMRQKDFKETSLLGCPVCYKTFADELKPFIAAMHKGCKHIGKIPVSAKIAGEVILLQKAMKKAIAEQNFEEAARLRDQIHTIKAT